MSKIKLSELGTFKNGLNYNSGNISNGGCKIIGIPDFADRYIADLRCLDEVDNIIVSDDYLLKKDDILFVRSNGNKALVGRTMIIGEVNDRITYSGFCIRFRPDKNKVLPLFLLYLFKSPQFRKYFSKSQQTSINNLNQDTLGSIILDLPDICTQEMIVKCIHSITRKIETNNRINDNLQQQMCLYFEQIMAKAQSGHLAGKMTTVKSLTDVITGKEDANFSVVDGDYKFFTCSNEVLRCNKYTFDSSSILIAGNGDFNVKHYSGKFNAYQRTYVLTPPKEYYAILYLSSLYHINSLKSSSAGSIVKFVTKGDIESIPVFQPDDLTYLHKLNNLILLQEQKFLENEKLVKLRDWLLPMLMNGQATISD